MEAELLKLFGSAATKPEATRVERRAIRLLRLEGLQAIVWPGGRLEAAARAGSYLGDLGASRSRIRTGNANSTEAGFRQIRVSQAW